MALSKYQRPYCENCKLIWGAQSIGRILNCPKCNKPLILKTFNPWPKVIAGLGIICFAGLSVFVREIQIIWIGGFLFGASLIFNGLQQWSKIKDLDQNRIEQKEESIKEDADHTIITCGKCFTKIRVLRGQGVIKIKCPNCSGEYRVMT